MNVSTKEILERFLRGEASIEDQRTLAAMLKSEQGCAAIGEQMDEDLDRLERSEVSDEVRERLERIYSDIERRMRRRSQLRRWSVAAAVLVPTIVCAVITWFVTGNYGAPELSSVVTRMGESTMVTYDDGTRVWLNGGSELQPLAAGCRSGERCVRFSGEGFFDVAKAQDGRSFVVMTDGGEVWVKGTRFNVESYAGSAVTLVTLEEGSVEFAAKNGDRQVLKPGEQLAYNRLSGTITVRETGNDAAAFGWKDDVVCFDRTPLPEVISRLERRYGVEFEVADSRAEQVTFSYRAEHQPIEAVLGELEMISPLRFMPVDGKVRVSLKK